MKNIILQTYRKAHETDWKRLILELAKLQILLIGFRIAEVNVSAVMGNDTSLEVPFNVPYYDESGKFLGRIEDTFWEMWNQIGRSIGKVNVKVVYKEESFLLKKEEDFLQVKEFVINVQLIAKKFFVNLNLAEGHILEDIKEGRPVYEEFTSTSFDWADVMKNQPGIEISPEEYKQVLEDSNVAADLGKAERFIRIVAINKHQ